MHSTIVDLQFHFVCYPVSTNITEGKAEEDNTSCGVHKREPILGQNLSRWIFFGQTLEKVTEKSTGETFSAPLVFVTALHLLENGWYDGASTKFNTGNKNNSITVQMTQSPQRQFSVLYDAHLRGLN